MFAEGAIDAIKESNSNIKEIQAVYVGNDDGNVEEGQNVLASYSATSECHGENMKIVELSGNGEVQTFTVIHVPAEGFNPAIYCRSG